MNEFKVELKRFNIDLDSIPELDDSFFEEIHTAMNNIWLDNYYGDLEVVLNGNLLECKNKYDGVKTIFGCKIKYQPLDEAISFIVRPTFTPKLKSEEDFKRADEMFEELGYKKIENGKDKVFHIEYVKYDKQEDKSITIQFWNDESFDKINNFEEVEYITMQELKAINKKVEELGWEE